MFIAVFIGIGLVSKEVERRSVYSLLAKPIRRSSSSSASTGAGLTLTLAVNATIMACGALYGVLAYMAWGTSVDQVAVRDAPALDPALLKAIGLIFGGADASDRDRHVLLDVFDTDAVGGVHLRGLRGGPLQRRPSQLPGIVESPMTVRLVRGLYWVLPNLAQFDVKDSVVHGVAVPAGYLALSVAYAALYIATLLVISVAIFSRRDFK